MDLRTIAAALGGEVTGRQVLAPGPGHSARDRSLSVRLSAQSPTGFIVHSYTGDDFRDARDYVAAKLGFGPDAWKRRGGRADVLGLYTSVSGRGQGRRTDLLDNVQEVPAAPTGTSKEAGLRTLQKAADEGNEARIARARAIWDAAEPATGSVVEVYLASRGLQLDLVSNIHKVLRFHPRCPWRDEELNSTIFVPAMVAALRQIQGDAITGIHRTRLGPDGTKLGRRMLGQASGAAVKLDPDDAVTMGLAIGEGIETCLAARQLDFRPAWALGSAGAIAVLPVLGGVEVLTILAENDDTNRRAVDACAARWHAAGREVIVVEPVAGSDLNDAMRGAA